MDDPCGSAQCAAGAYTAIGTGKDARSGTIAFKPPFGVSLPATVAFQLNCVKVSGMRKVLRIRRAHLKV